jgi:hypothetical protein
LNWDKIVNRPSFNPLDPQSKILVRDDTVGEDPYFNSYSGTDVSIYLLFDDGDTNQGIRNFRPFREIQTLSVSSARSVHPVRRLGESHVTEYTRGARTIAGSMVCVSGDRDPLAKIAAKSLREKSSDVPFFTDELPAFNILIMASDEYGNVSHAALTDLTITNFGQTFSADDLYLENTYTYVARYYHPLLPDPSVLNHLPQRYGPRNRASKVFINGWGTTGGSGDIKNFVNESNISNLASEQFDVSIDLDAEDRAVSREWLLRQTLLNQAAGTGS